MLLRIYANKSHRCGNSISNKLLKLLIISISNKLLKFPLKGSFLVDTSLYFPWSISSKRASENSVGKRKYL